MKAVKVPKGRKMYCGPTAICALTGLDPITVLDACYEAAHGELGFGERRKPLRGMFLRQVREVLEGFGYAVVQDDFNYHRPTLAKFLAGRTPEERKAKLLINVTGHFVAVEGARFCDTANDRQVIPLAKAPGRRKRVRAVLMLKEAA